MATLDSTEVTVRSVDERDEMRIYTVKYVLSEFATRIGVYPPEWLVDLPEEEDVDLKYMGRVCTCLVNEIVKNAKEVSYIVVDFHSVTILRRMNYDWAEIEPKIFEAIEKALKVETRFLGKQLT